MIIANPIYDTVFKYLMSDTDDNIAKRFIEQILNIDIIELNFDRIETTAIVEDREKTDIPLSIYKLDFIAKIATDEGPKMILIELQKSWEELDIHRFRNYLASEYKRHYAAYLNYLDELMKVRKIVEKCKKENKPVPDLPKKNIPKALPIVAIYILDKEVYPDKMMIHVEPVYKDPNNNNEILKGKCDFIEQLVHNSYFIQIPRIPNNPETEYEKVFSIFNQTFLVDNDRRRVNYQTELEDIKNPLLHDMLLKLQKIAVDKEIAKEIEAKEAGRKMLEERDILTWHKFALAEEKIRKAEEQTKEANKKAEEERIRAEKYKKELEYMRAELAKIENKK